MVDGLRIVNAGSVGLPYEARRGAYWLLAGPEILLRRTEYDVAEASRLILATGYPRAEEAARDLSLEDAQRPARMSKLIEGLA